jgi:hypothetical protein
MIADENEGIILLFHKHLQYAWHYLLLYHGCFQQFLCE